MNLKQKKEDYPKYTETITVKILNLAHFKQIINSSLTSHTLDAFLLDTHTSAIMSESRLPKKNKNLTLTESFF